MRLEHIYSFTKARSLEEQLARYRRAGFVLGTKTVRHPPGLRNGFVYIGTEYLEWLWVEDMCAFQAGKPNYSDLFRENPGPFGFGFDTPNAERFHQSLVQRGFSVPDTFSRGPADAPENSEPWWTFQYFPRRFLPGVHPFVLTYARRDYAAPLRAYIGPNGIFAIAGILFAANTPERDATRWAEVFRLGTPVLRDGGATLGLGTHTLTWMQPATLRRCFGADAYLPVSSPFSHLRKVAAIHLYAEDLERAERYLREAGRRTVRVQYGNTPCLYAHAYPSDGYAFIISEYSLAEWKRDSEYKIGKTIRVVRTTER